MNVNTKYFNEIQIEEKRIIAFHKGLPGFEELRQFILLELPDNEMFKCLQSMEERDVAFLVTKPWDFFPSYEFELPEDEMEELSIEKKEQIEVYTLISIPSDPKKMTTNLLAPVIINWDTMEGKQLILHNSSYQTKHRLFEGLSGVDNDACTD